MKLKHPKASQCRTNRKRRRPRKQMIYRHVRKPKSDAHRRAILKMDQRVTEREIEIAAIGVALTAFSYFKLVQAGRNPRWRVAAKKLNPNVGLSIGRR